MMHRGIHQTVAAEFGGIRIKHHLILAGRSQEPVIRKRLVGTPVEHKNQVTAHEGQHLVVVLLPELMNRFGLETELG